MLTRTPKPQPDDLDYFFSALQLPVRPVEVATADQAWRKAVADLQAAQSRHVEAGRLLNEQRFGRPVTITHAEVDEIGADIVQLMTAEAEARAKRDRARQAYRDSVAASLEDPLKRYQAAVADKITELEDFLAVAMLLNSEAVSVGVKLPSKLPGIAPAMASHLQGLRIMLRRIG